jgi:peroxiredoxin-like protein
MEKLPHHYTIKASSKTKSDLTLSANHLPNMNIAPPAQFDGPGDIWSPEDLLMASVASCTILSFKAIARMSKLEWISINCQSEGTLDRINKKAQFTQIKTKVHLTIAEETDQEKAYKLLEKAESSCLITHSLKAEMIAEFEVTYQKESILEKP